MKNDRLTLALLFVFLFGMVVPLFSACSGDSSSDDDDDDDNNNTSPGTDDDSPADDDNNDNDDTSPGEDDDSSSDDDNDNNDDDATPACSPPVAEFDASPGTGDAPLAVAFNDLSTTAPECPITEHQWSFGDGNSSSVAEPTNSYEIGGNYTVSLTVTNAGGSDTKTKTDYILVDCPTPTADFNGSPVSGDLPLTVAFSDASVTHCQAATYDWDFGDGGGSTAPSPSHQYMTSGIFSVSLTVTTSGGSDTMLIDDYITASCPEPTAGFAAVPTAGRLPLTVNFSNTSVSYCPIDTNAWNFGDGTFSNEQNPSHVYDTPASYSVSLTITGEGGTDVELKSDFIVVDDNPLVGAYPGAGDAHDVVAVGDVTYVADGSGGLLTLNTADPTAPAFLDRLELYGSAVDVDVAAGIAAVSQASAGLSLVDASDPANLTELGYYNPAGTDIYATVLRDEYAYCATGGDELLILDVSDPTDPTTLVEFNITGYANDLEVVENDWGVFALLAMGSAGLAVVDIGDPETPALIAVTDTDEAMGLKVDGPLALVADSLGGLQVFDLFSIKPRQVGNYHEAYSFTQGVAAQGDYVYLAEYSNGLTIIDVSDPANPSPVGSYDTAGHTEGVFISGHYAFLADDENGLEIVDVQNPTAPSLAGNYHTASSETLEVFAAGDYAFVLHDRKTLLSIDVSDPTAPVLAGSYSSAASLFSVTGQGNYLYCANSDEGMLVLDVNDPTAPAYAGAFDPGTLNARDVAVDSDYAYLAGGDEGLKIVNIQNPSSPFFVASHDPGGFAGDVAKNGDLAMLEIGTRGVAFYDVTDPTNPLFLRLVETYFPQDIYAQGQYVYVADSANGVTVIDASGLHADWLGGYSDSESYSQQVAVSGRYAYLADYGTGLTAIDLLDPAAPVLADRFVNNGYPYGVFADEQYVYLADQDNGLLIFSQYPSNW